MAKYRCLACGYEYDEESEHKVWSELEDDYLCPICSSDKSFFEEVEETPEAAVAENSKPSDSSKAYLSEWAKSDEASEPYFRKIHAMADGETSETEAMKTLKPIISWDNVLIKGAQLSKFPVNQDEAIETKTIIGPNAKKPLEIDTPIYISHMSYGALSAEIKTALAKGSAKANTLICSGEGGILPDEIDNAYKYIFEYIPNEYSCTDENLKRADAIEIKIGQSAKPGMGGHLPGDKVTAEIAKVRGKKEGEDIHSPAQFKDIKSKEDLKAKVDWLRAKSEGRPIGIKIAAGNIEADLEVILFAKPDFITIDGRGGATGSAPKHIKDNTSVPTLFALCRARKYLDANDASDISLVITGGLRVASDFAKAIAMGADAIAVASAAMIAGGCQQYRICNTGNCPLGIATQDPKLRKRLNIEKSAERVGNYLIQSTEELKSFARITGNSNIHDLSVKDLCTDNSEISGYTDIEHV